MSRIGIAIWATLLFVSKLAASNTYVIVRLAPDADRQLISRSGAMEVTHPDLRADEVLVYASDEQLLAIRNESGVALVYPAAQELISGIPVNACAHTMEENETLVEGEVGEYVRLVGNGWTNGVKTSLRLTYSLGSVSPKLGREKMLAAIQAALAEWSKYVQVDFVYTSRTDGLRNLNFTFASGPHGDSFPFDGPGRTLAHTFYPAGVNAEPIAGDLHFDEDENWQNGMDPDFYSVVLHEVGHALGLGHADQPNAVMYPYFRKMEALQQDDINAIRGLYAARRPSSLTPEPTVVKSDDKTAPKIAISFPGTTVYSTSADTVRIAGTASDNVGVTSINWTSSGGRSGVANGTATWTIPDFALRSGDNTIVIRAFDQAGNSSWRSLTVTRR